MPKQKPQLTEKQIIAINRIYPKYAKSQLKLAYCQTMPLCMSNEYKEYSKYEAELLAIFNNPDDYA